MPRLTMVRSRPRPRGRGDRGGAAVLVSVLLAGGVLLGMTALVVDVGSLYAEREELLSGADAAAFAIALDCALDRADCGDADDTADEYAGRNARDGVSDATVCGNHPVLDACTSGPGGGLIDCLGERPTDGTAYVEVRTTTRLPDGSTLLPPSFAQTLVPGYQGATVGACSRVAWGAPGDGLAVTISTCEFAKATEAGEDLAEPPPPDPDPSYERVIKLHTTDPECEAPVPGFDGPGGFGWLEGEDCQVEIVEDENGDFWYSTDTGSDVPQDCRAVLPGLQANKTVVKVPVFDAVRGTGNNLEYRLHAIASFVVTGYHAPGLRASSNLFNSTITECSGSDFCIYGYFTTSVDSGEVGPLPGFGAMVVKTIG